MHLSTTHHHRELALMVACHSLQLVTAICDVEGDGSDTL